MALSKKTVSMISGDATLVGDIYLPQRGTSIQNSGSAIIIETGLSLNRHGMFSEFARYFAEHGFISFVYDLRSHNESTGRFSCALLKDDLLSVMKHLLKGYGIRRFGLFGFCYGGIPAMEAAVECPEIKVFCGISTYNRYLDVALRQGNGFPVHIQALHRISNALHKMGVLKYLPFTSRNFHIAPLEKGTGFRGNMSLLFEDLSAAEDAIMYSKNIKKITQRLFNTCHSRTKKLFTYDEAGHFFHSQRAEMLSDCLKIYKKYLKG
jgi:alpha/beta superfamily hydrolase